MLLLQNSLAQVGIKPAVPISVNDPIVHKAANVCAQARQKSMAADMKTTIEVHSIIGALSQVSDAEVFERKDENFFGMRMPMEVGKMEQGQELFIMVILAHYVGTPLTRMLNPWPTLELNMFKVFVKGNQMKPDGLVVPPRKLDLSIHSPTVLRASTTAMDWLRAQPPVRNTWSQNAGNYRIAGVLSVEKQRLQIKHLEKLMKKPQTELERDIYFLSILTQNTRTKAVQAHMFAVSQGTGEGESMHTMSVVDHFAFDAAGNALVTAKLAITGVPVAKVRESYGEMKNALVMSGGRTAGIINANDVEIVGVWEDKGMTRNTVEVSLSIGVAGSGDPLVSLFMDAEFTDHLAAALNKKHFKVHPDQLAITEPKKLITSEPSAPTSCKAIRIPVPVPVPAPGCDPSVQPGSPGDAWAQSRLMPPPQSGPGMEMRGPPPRDGGSVGGSVVSFAAGVLLASAGWMYQAHQAQQEEEASSGGSGGNGYTNIGSGSVGPQKDLEATSPVAGGSFQGGGGGTDGQPSFDL
jgi:hypothetical protein